MSVRVGMGVVVARLPSGKWSAPAAIGVGGFGGGFNAGAEMVDFLIVLNTTAAVRTFMASGFLQLGGNLSLAVGPLGRTGEAGASINGDMQLAAMFTYCVSRGLYGGITIEGTLLGDRPDTNERTYGRSYTAAEILSGQVDVPKCAIPLVARLEEITGFEPFESSIYDGPRGYLDPTMDYVRRPEQRRRPPPPGTKAEPLDSSLEDDHGPFSPPPYSSLQNSTNAPNMSSRLNSAGKGSSRAGEFDNEDPFSDSQGSQYDPNMLSYEPRSKLGSRRTMAQTSASTLLKLDQAQFHSSNAYGLDNSFDADFDAPLSEPTQPNGSRSPATGLIDTGVLDGDLVVAIHDFMAQKPSDLSFQRGDIIRVVHRTNKSNDWWSGELVAQFSDGPSRIGQYV